MNTYINLQQLNKMLFLEDLHNLKKNLTNS